MRQRYYTVVLAIAVCVAVLAFLWVGWKLNPPVDDATSQVAGVVVPALVGAEQNGQVLFGKYCASCHGQAGEGSDNGPPLIDKIYEPSHHGDEAFYVAALLGARAHHWQFGNMLKVQGITEQEVGDVVAFVRKVQRANGIN